MSRNTAKSALVSLDLDQSIYSTLDEAIRGRIVFLDSKMKGFGSITVRGALATVISGGSLKNGHSCSVLRSVWLDCSSTRRFMEGTNARLVSKSFSELKQSVFLRADSGPNGRLTG